MNVNIKSSLWKSNLRYRTCSSIACHMQLYAKDMCTLFINQMVHGNEKSYYPSLKCKCPNIICNVHQVACTPNKSLNNEHQHSITRFGSLPLPKFRCVYEILIMQTKWSFLMLICRRCYAFPSRILPDPCR